MLLVLNKLDLVEEKAERDEELEDYMMEEYHQRFAEEHGFIGSMCTSAKAGIGVVESISAIVRSILMKELEGDNESEKYQDNDKV